jgi:short subunit dehydrogenase-like uncharacterized protein
MATIAVYGATGYTGRLVARELERRGLDARLCGRSGGKLKALVGELGVDWECRAATIDDFAGLRRALDGAAAVINCAGPFTYYGSPVIEAAIDVGAHYCDTTGEQPYMQRVFEFLGGPASSAGVAVVPAVGFDYVPGDLACALAARGHEPVNDLTVAYAVTGFGATRGTLHSALEMIGGEQLEYRGGSWHQAGMSLRGETFDFGGDLGSQLVARYPGGEIVTVPRHVNVQNIRQRITASTFAPTPRATVAVPAITGLAALALKTPLGGAIDALIDRLPEGPSEDDRRASAFRIVAEAHGADGTTGRCEVRGRDVYGITAVMAVEFAHRMTEGGFAKRGALAPAQVVDPEKFLGFLADHDVTYDWQPPSRPEKRRTSSRAKSTTRP